MEKGYNFSVDTRLCVNSWGEQIAELTGKGVASVVGRKYYRIIPRIFSGDRDALSVVLEKKRGIALKGYSFGCLFDHVRTDIRINPLLSSKDIKGVRITLSNISPCSITRSFQNSQRFIDIGKTASTLAHGVRNPLNAIKGAVVYLSEKYAHEPALVEFAKIMNDEISRLDGFISKFLSSSLLDASPSLTDINSVLSKIEMLTSLQAHAYNIQTRYVYGDIPRISVNTFYIEQAILNVINNSIEAMRSGGQLTVKTGSENLSSVHFAVIDISDTGPGIAQIKSAHVPMPMKDKGKGFGLFIAREILQYYGGRLEIISRKGKGTRVKLFFPVSTVSK